MISELMEFILGFTVGAIVGGILLRFVWNKFCVDKNASKVKEGGG